MHGGVKFYRGSAAAARTYVEADRSRVDDYYLAEGTGVATRYVGTASPRTGGPCVPAVQTGRTLDGDAYEQWVAGYHVDTGAAKGRLRTDDRGLRFVEVVVNGPKTWSLAASVHPEIAAAYDAAQERAAVEIIDWLTQHTTTRVGPRGRQVQVPVEKLEAAVVRHHTSRAGDPHRHLHLQVNARVFAAGSWRGLHSVGVVDSIEAINGIGHAAIACDPDFRQTLTRLGYTLDPQNGEIRELAPYVGRFSARTSQINRNLDRYEATWRAEHPGQEPGPKLRQTWDRRAWSDARPDKVVPTDGADLARRWNQELLDLGFAPPTPATPEAVIRSVPPTSPLVSHPTSPQVSHPTSPQPKPVGQVDRDATADLVLTRLAAKRSSWNAADIRGQVETSIAAHNVIVAPQVRRELAEDITARAVRRSVALLHRDDVPEHVRHLSSPHVLDVETAITTSLTRRAQHPGALVSVGRVIAGRTVDATQRRVVAALAGTSDLLVIEGAAGAGKTTTLAAAAELLNRKHQELVVVTPTLKAARVAADQLGTDAFSAAWLIHQHGYRWDQDGHRSRLRIPRRDMDPMARLLPGDVLLVDEAGMLDQDTALALLTVADEVGARVALVGDRHQLPAVGRGGVLELAARWAHPDSVLTLDAVHRFTDPHYADLTLQMRTGERPGEVFDDLLVHGQILIHPTDVERLAHLAALASDTATNSAPPRPRPRPELVIADTREQVSSLNAAIRDQRRQPTGEASAPAVDSGPAVDTSPIITARGEQVGVGDRVATRRNDREIGVANRDTWTVTGLHADGGLQVRGRGGERTLPPMYAHEHVELAYATTVYGAQGETVDRAHLVVGDTTGAASAYVGMTRGRHHNTAHLVAETVEDARAQWVTVFSRDRADLGPGHAARQAAADIDRYGSQPRRVAARPEWQQPDLSISDNAQRRMKAAQQPRPSPYHVGPGIGR